MSAASCPFHHCPSSSMGRDGTAGDQSGEPAGQKKRKKKGKPQPVVNSSMGRNSRAKPLSYAAGRNSSPPQPESQTFPSKEEEEAGRGCAPADFTSPRGGIGKQSDPLKVSPGTAGARLTRDLPKPGKPGRWSGRSGSRPGLPDRAQPSLSRNNFQLLPAEKGTPARSSGGGGDATTTTKG